MQKKTSANGVAAGYYEIPHTADVALGVWAPDLVALFVEAARGFNFVSGAVMGPGPRSTRQIQLHEIDDESLLVAFLTELVLAQEQDHLVFDDFRLQVVKHRLTGELGGARFGTLAKPIKAVTFHNLRIEQSGRGLEVRIVFDV